MTQAELHKLFTTESAKTTFINALLSECKKNGYSGFQFDFENVNWTDRDLLTALVAETSAALESDVLAAVRPGDAVMIKGSLGSRMTPIVKALQSRYRRETPILTPAQASIVDG